MQQNLVIWLHSFAFDKSSLIYNQVFFFFSRIITMNSFGCKGPNSKSFRDFFFWWCNFRNHGVWSRITSSKDFFSPKTLQICKDTYHFDNNHESNLKPYWNREMIKECVNIIAIKTFINLVFSSKEFHFFFIDELQGRPIFIRSCIQGRLLIAYVNTTPTLRKYSLISDLVIFISKRCL